MSVFAEHWDQVDWAAVHGGSGWQAERVDEVGYITMSARDGVAYRLRLECKGYPQKAPSAAFADEKGLVSNVKAWPKGSGDFGSAVHPPPDTFICTPLTREGLEHHPEWKSRADPWSVDKHFLDVANYVQRLLSGPTYGGRAG
jgi:hypothetical protein